ncbi:hypothetical protein [Flavicella sp.]|uniref:hypothetical protein n=1 Tax=Flavicella sp. TaxID=2957742 RepID=UPI00301A0088
MEEKETTLTSSGPGKNLNIESVRIKIWNGDKVYVDEIKDAKPNKNGVKLT